MIVRWPNVAAGSGAVNCRSAIRMSSAVTCRSVSNLIRAVPLPDAAARNPRSQSIDRLRAGDIAEWWIWSNIRLNRC
jgi:hypothetical protein